METIRLWFDSHDEKDASKIDRVVFIVRDGQCHEAYERLMMECFPFSKDANPFLRSVDKTRNAFDLPDAPQDSDEEENEKSKTVTTNVNDLERRLRNLFM